MDRSVRKVIPVEQGLRQLFNCLIVYDTLYVRKVIPVEQGLRPSANGSFSGCAVMC